VERLNYKEVVEKMAGMPEEQFGSVLIEALRKIGRCESEMEKIYFWRALANAARNQAVVTGDHRVWLWLCIICPWLNPTGYVYPELVPDFPLPKVPHP